MTETLSRTIALLWKEAPLWRSSVVGALLCTMLAIVASSTPRRGGAAPPSGGSYQSGVAGSPAPLPTVPGVLNAVPPVDQSSLAESDGRLQTFAALADLAAREARPGVKCARLAQAVKPITQADVSRADARQRQAYSDAKGCELEIEESDKRLEAVSQLAGTVSEDDSALNFSELARSSAAITSFDRSRLLTAEQQAALTAGERAQRGIAESDARIASLSSAADAFKTGETAQTRETLASTVRSLTRFDRTRMTQEQEADLRLGERAGLAAREAEQRMSELMLAVTEAERNDSETNRRRVVTAVAALAPQDEAGSASVARTSLERARALASRYALDSLVPRAAEFSAAPTNEGRIELAAIRRVLGAAEGASLTPEQRRALATADAAAAAVNSSDHRLAALVEAANAWRQSPGRAASDQAASAVRAITELDRGRFTAEQKSAYDEARAATSFAAGASEPLAPEGRAHVPVYVATHADAQGGSSYAATLLERLSREGFPIVEDRQHAALVLEIDGTVTARGTTTLGSTALATVRTEVALKATRAAESQPFFQAVGQGNGASVSADAAIAQSYQRSAEDAFEQFAQRALPGHGH